METLLAEVAAGLLVVLLKELLTRVTRALLPAAT